MPKDRTYENSKRVREFLILQFQFVVLSMLASFALLSPFEIAGINKISEKTTIQSTSDISTSMSVEKIIVWFCVGTLGYTVFYAIGKNIAEK